MFARTGDVFVYTLVIWEILVVVELWVLNQFGLVGGTANTDYEILNNLYIDNG